MPTVISVYTGFNCTSRKTTTRVNCRIIFPGLVSRQDVVFEWVHRRLLKLRVRWPQWFQYAENMAVFKTNDRGDPMYDANHSLMIDMNSRNEERVEEDRCVWDEGFIDFEEDMVIDNVPEIDFLNVTVSQRQTKVLNIHAE